MFCYRKAPIVICTGSAVDGLSTIVVYWNLWVLCGTVPCPYQDQKIWLFLFGGNNISSHIYLDCGIISRYQFACKPQYKLLSMSVTFWLCQIAHNPSTEYWRNSQGSSFWVLRISLNHYEIFKPIPYKRTTFLKLKTIRHAYFYIRPPPEKHSAIFGLKVIQNKEQKMLQGCWLIILVAI